MVNSLPLCLVSMLKPFTDMKGGLENPVQIFSKWWQTKTGANLEWLIAGDGEPDLSPLEVRPESLPSSHSAELLTSMNRVPNVQNWNHD